MKNTSAGVFFFSKTTNRFLFLLRNDKQNPSWSIPGGKLEQSETLKDGLERECIEELNYWPIDPKLIPIQKFINNSFTYHTFFCAVDTEFIPKLNKEHLGYAWVEVDSYPKPLHPGLFSTINFDIVREKLNTLTNKKRP